MVVLVFFGGFGSFGGFGGGLGGCGDAFYADMWGEESFGFFIDLLGKHACGHHEEGLVGVGHHYAREDYYRFATAHITDDDAPRCSGAS